MGAKILEIGRKIGALSSTYLGLNLTSHQILIKASLKKSAISLEKR
jgi:hypothetical protein